MIAWNGIEPATPGSPAIVIPGERSETRNPAARESANLSGATLLAPACRNSSPSVALCSGLRRNDDSCLEDDALLTICRLSAYPASTTR